LSLALNKGRESIIPLSLVHPSLFNEIIVDLSLLKKREKGHFSESCSFQSYIENKYFGYVQVYTDASESLSSNNGVSFIVPEFNIKKCKRISDDVSVFTGEIMGIILALSWIEEVRPLRSLICSDSSSSLYSIKNNQSNSRPDLLLEIQLILFRIQAMGLIVIFTWVPSHIGVIGNELADRYAKQASKNSYIEILIPFSKEEIKSIIKQKVKERWQKQWEEERTGRWLYSIQRKVGVMRGTGRSRKEENIISRLRFGHTGLNSTLFIMGRHPSRNCEFCFEEETVEHVLLLCPKYSEERKKLEYRLLKNKLQLKISDMLGYCSSSEYLRYLISFLKKTKLIERI